MGTMILCHRLFVCFLLWGGMELCYSQTTWRSETPSPRPSKAPVVVECLEAQLVVTVNKDLFGTGKLVRPADLTLGPENCEPLDQDNVVRFEVGLHKCGSSMQVRLGPQGWFQWGAWWGCCRASSRWVKAAPFPWLGGREEQLRLGAGHW